MKIVCDSISDFQINTRDAVDKGGRLFENTVRFLKDTTTRSVAVSRILLVLTAVVVTKDGDRYLLETIKDCGFDYFDSGDLQGSAAFDGFLQNVLPQWCESHKFYLLPGRIEL